MDLASLRKKENWLFKYWRPAMAWQYFIVCMFDFFLAPAATMILSYLLKMPISPWKPITLEGGAIYHASMGAVTGVTAWSRGQEKIAVIKSATESAIIAESDSQSVKPVRRQGEDE